MITPLDPVIAQIIPLLPLRDPDNMTPQSARDALSALAAARAAVPPPPVMSAEDIEVKGAAGPLAARLYRNSNGKSPTVVFFHGGSRRQMLLGWNPMGYYSNAYAMNQYLASRGYVVLSINYRSGIGYGLDFRQALHFGPGGASEYNDVIGAGLYLQTRADVDGSRLLHAGPPKDLSLRSDPRPRPRPRRSRSSADQASNVYSCVYRYWLFRLLLVPTPVAPGAG